MDRDIELRERTVRVEEELKAQRELMREGFAHIGEAVRANRQTLRAHRQTLRAYATADGSAL